MPRFILGLAALAVTGALAGCSSGPQAAAQTTQSTAGSAASAKPKADPANHGQTPAQVTAGYCKRVGQELLGYGLQRAEGNMSTAAESAQNTGNTQPAMDAIHKVGDSAGTTAAAIGMIDRLPALDPKVGARVTALRGTLNNLSDVAGNTYTVSDLDSFGTANDAMTAAMGMFTKACAT